MYAICLKVTPTYTGCDKILKRRTTEPAGANHEHRSTLQFNLPCRNISDRLSLGYHSVCLYTLKPERLEDHLSPIACIVVDMREVGKFVIVGGHQPVRGVTSSLCSRHDVEFHLTSPPPTIIRYAGYDGGTSNARGVSAFNIK